MYLPIEDYAVIGDGLTVALVSRHGSIDWAAFPRFDAPSVFARLLDSQKGGHFFIRPTGDYAVTRQYLPDTNVLVTVYQGPEGDEVEVVDFMPPHFSGPTRPSDNLVVRIVRGRLGRMEMAVEYAPRFDYARARATWSRAEGVGVRATAVGCSLTLYSGVQLDIDAERDIASATFVVHAGVTHPFVLSFRQPASIMFRSHLPDGALSMLDQTVEFWMRWIARCTYRGPHEAMVRRSALTLKLLDYAPTGAIVAAPTTSLPEAIGGVRNWDYRYAWLRDTAFTLYALFNLGYREEAESFLDWVFDVSGGDPRNLQVLYGIAGERGIHEFELDHLEGYRRSRPVRVGNAAYLQRQLDIYGEVVDCAFLYHKAGGTISDALWDFLRRTANYICEVWQTPDSGIWEVRSEPQHFVYSKCLCWVGVDRAIKLAERTGHNGEVARWREVRQAIFDSLMTEGYDRELGAFTQAYGSREMDAASLAILLRQVLPPTDPRMVLTVDRVVEELSEGELLHRYRETADDGLPGGEGVFLMCSFILATCYAEMGRISQARALFERLLTYANDVGLYAEEYDVAGQHHLGNFPQAFTHIALINAAVTLARLDPAAPSFTPDGH